MKLLIISHTPHYRNLSGKTCGWGPTVSEINCLPELFSEIRHIAPLYSGQPPASSMEYQSIQIRLIPVTPAGGEKFSDKIRVLREFPRYLMIILKELKNTDVVHVRCPANISMLAIILLAFIGYPRKRWIKYAGNWNPKTGDAWSSKFQRWWLKKNFSKTVVTVNGDWPNQPKHIVPFLNPSLTYEDLKNGSQGAENKSLGEPLRILFVGALEPFKGTNALISMAELLQRSTIRFSLEIVGDGSQRSRMETRVKQLDLKNQIYFFGWRSKNDLRSFYSKAHFLVAPSSSEGWPKVISEAMAYGAVPLASNVSCIPQYLRRFQTGKSLDPKRPEDFVEAIEYYTQNPEVWKSESENAIRAAVNFTYERYLQRVKEILDLEK